MPLNICTFVSKVMSLLFNMLSGIVIAFLPRSKHLLISWLQSPSAVILEPKKINSVTVSLVSPSICYEVMGPDDMIFVFWMLSFKPAFSLSSLTFIKGLFSSSSLSAISMVSSAYLGLLIILPEIFFFFDVWHYCIYLRMYLNQTAKFNNAKLQLLLHQYNTLCDFSYVLICLGCVLWPRIYINTVYLSTHSIRFWKEICVLLLFGGVFCTRDWVLLVGSAVEFCSLADFSLVLPFVERRMSVSN